MEIKQTQKFHKWFSKLDNVTSAIVFARLLVVSMGSLGLWRSVGKGVSELKINHGPGYRVYFTFRGGELILLLVGGDKRHQKEDIKKAQEMAQCPIEDCENFFEGNNDEDDKSAAVFLNEMIKLDSGDGSMVRLAIGNIIKCHNVSEIAKTACVSRASLYSAFNKDGNPSFDMVQKVLAAMGLGIQFVPLENR